MYSCSTCKKVYSTNFNLLKHMRNVHDQNMYLKKSNINCLHCHVIFKHLKELRIHLTESHGITTTTSHLSFGNFSDFKEWKRKEEIQNCCRYVAIRGATHMADGRVKKEFVCHRSGSDKIEKRSSIKASNSYKLNCTCPASIETVINVNDTVDVTFYSTHIEHSNDVKYLSMGREERALIGTKLASGCTFSKVLEEVKNSNKSDSVSPRYYNITKKDLYNIKAYFELHDVYELDETNGTFRIIPRNNQVQINETVIDRDVKKNHRIGLRMDRDDITEVDSCLWDVKTYTVQMIQPIPCNCDVKCFFCKICVHMFKCNCFVSHTDENTICSHIHAVVNYLGNDENLLLERFLNKEKRECSDTSTAESYQIQTEDDGEENLIIEIKPESIQGDWDSSSDVDEEIVFVDDSVLNTDQDLSPVLEETICIY